MLLYHYSFCWSSAHDPQFITTLYFPCFFKITTQAFAQSFSIGLFLFTFSGNIVKHMDYLDSFFSLGCCSSVNILTFFLIWIQFNSSLSESDKFKSIWTLLFLSVKRDLEFTSYSCETLSLTPTVTYSMCSTHCLYCMVVCVALVHVWGGWYSLWKFEGVWPVECRG